ncbi:PREDICTED: pre-mRNA-splicing factor SPF27-like [Elephantulus edwardii]|uniref:pre-mRNA-splicing factor SPF27-like n=1 Tax=Elephantulus edwardii TaxID=28737 RepID=UPI0003F08959|nr:PREDICTED: pre-mRNA-splicing factor SPF27-like [Elephantulus edwardii]
MAGTVLVAGEIVVDALPYFDQGYEGPNIHEEAEALVEEETHRYRSTKNNQSYLIVQNYSGSENDIMINEFQRLADQQPIEFLSMKWYELTAPSSGQKNVIIAWQGCVNNSMLQLEHQAVRIENLEVMSQQWLGINKNLVHMIEHTQKELQKLKKHIIIEGKLMVKTLQNGKEIFGSDVSDKGFITNFTETRSKEEKQFKSDI